MTGVITRRWIPSVALVLVLVLAACGRDLAAQLPDAAVDTVVRAATAYRLPWRPGVAMQLTQDCDDTCCGDHVGPDAYAYDWANGGAFTVVAARGGTITHLKISSTLGCGTSACVDDANYIVIDHGDGTQATYLHLAGATLAPGIACGRAVARGQALATSGTTGWATGVHLHFQVSRVHPGVATCECGADGSGCAATAADWAAFWVTRAYPTVPVQFDAWPDAPRCADRRIAMPAPVTRIPVAAAVAATATTRASPP